MADSFAISVCSKLAEYTVKPLLLDPVVKRFGYLWKYSSNRENLRTKLQDLQRNCRNIQKFTDDGADSVQAVKDWHDEVTKISNEAARFTGQQNSQQQSMNCCQRLSCSNLPQWYGDRKEVRQLLERVDQLHERFTESRPEWEYKSNVENLKHKMKDLEAAKERRQNSRNDGEEAVPNAQEWLGKVHDISREILVITSSQPQALECCKGFICRNCCEYNRKIVCKLEDVGRLLEEERGFEKFWTAGAKAIYKINLLNLCEEVEKLKLQKGSVELSIKPGEEPLPHVKAWSNKAMEIINDVLQLNREYNPERLTTNKLLLKKVKKALLDTNDK